MSYYKHTNSVNFVGTYQNILITANDNSVNIFKNNFNFKNCENIMDKIFKNKIKTNNIIYSINDKYLALCDKTSVYVYNLEEESVKNFKHKQNNVVSMAINKNGQIILSNNLNIVIYKSISISDKFFINLNNVKNVNFIKNYIVFTINNKLYIFKENKEILSNEDHSLQINVIDVNEDLIITGSDDCTAIIFKFTNKKLNKLSYLINSDKISAVSILKKTNYAAVASGLKINLWSIDGLLLCSYTGHTKLINCISIYDNYILSGSLDTFSYMWPLESNKLDKSNKSNKLNKLNKSNEFKNINDILSKTDKIDKTKSNKTEHVNKKLKYVRDNSSESEDSSDSLGSEDTYSTDLSANSEDEGFISEHDDVINYKNNKNNKNKNNNNKNIDKNPEDSEDPDEMPEDPEDPEDPDEMPEDLLDELEDLQNDLMDFLKELLNNDNVKLIEDLSKDPKEPEEPVVSLISVKDFKLNKSVDKIVNLKTFISILTNPDISKQQQDLIDSLKELDILIGLDILKDQLINQILFFMEDLMEPGFFLHTVITGPPGTGKTTVIKILAKIYKSLGLLKTDNVISASRSDLIAQYVGQTAPKTKKVLESSLGSVLYIDEAYSLGSKEDGDYFAKEAIDTINQFLSEHVDEFICIIAGYEDELNKCFFNKNSGLKRRFPWSFNIEAYSGEDLYLILNKQLIEEGWSFSEDITKDSIIAFINENKESFSGNGGSTKNFIDKCKTYYSRRNFSEGNGLVDKIIKKQDFERTILDFKVVSKNEICKWCEVDENDKKEKDSCVSCNKHKNDNKYLEFYS